SRLSGTPPFIRSLTMQYSNPTGNMKEIFCRTQAKQPLIKSFAPCSDRAYRFCRRLSILLYLLLYLPLNGSLIVLPHPGEQTASFHQLTAGTALCDLPVFYNVNPV